MLPKWFLPVLALIDEFLHVILKFFKKDGD